MQKDFNYNIFFTQDRFLDFTLIPTFIVVPILQFVPVFNVLYTAFSTTSLSITSLNFFKSLGTVSNFPTSNLSAFLSKSKSFKPVETLTHLLMSSLPTSPFKAIKCFLAAKSDVSVPVAFPNSFLTA